MLTLELVQVGAGIQIPPNASRIWFQYGLLDKLKEYAFEPNAKYVRRWKDGSLLCRRRINDEIDKRFPWL